MIRSVRRNGHRVFLLTDEKDNYAGRSRYLNGVREFCVGKDSYPKLLEEMIRKESIDAIMRNFNHLPGTKCPVMMIS